MDKSRVKLIIVSAILLGILTTLWLVWSHKHSPDYTQKISSRDTGETAYSQPNKTPEKSEGDTNIILFGSYLILDNGSTQGQFDQIKKAFSMYSSKNLHDTYPSLTLVPSTFSASAGDMKSSLRLGDTNNMVTAEIKVWQVKYARLWIRDPSGKNGGGYDSGMLTVADDPPATSQSKTP